MLLRNFYRAYYKWATSPSQYKSPTFRGTYGLCRNLENWVYDNCIKNPDKELVRLMGRLEKQFKNAGLNPNYPFGFDDYFDYPGPLDPARMAWVKKHLR